DESRAATDSSSRSIVGGTSVGSVSVTVLQLPLRDRGGAHDGPAGARDCPSQAGVDERGHELEVDLQGVARASGYAGVVPPGERAARCLVRVVEVAVGPPMRPV